MRWSLHLSVASLAVSVALAAVPAAAQSNPPDETGASAAVEVTPAPSQLTEKERKAAERAARDEQKRAAKAAKDAAGARLKGPVESDIVLFLEDKDPELQFAYRALFVDGERNSVLHLERIGLLEMQKGNYQAAAWAFDNALQRIEFIYAKDPAAKAAKSVWTEEKIKDFKGEPYERAMAYYYRGLLYLMQGDFQNARASFISGEYQDTVAEAEEFEGDFALLDFLAGWASQCDGDMTLADEYYGYAREANEAFVKPAQDHNLLLLSDIGVGPTKIHQGQYGEFLTFSPGRRESFKTVFEITPDGGGPLLIDGPELTSLTYQAQTRGGKPFQNILNGKAQFKETTQAIGTVGTTLGAGLLAAGIENNDDDLMYAGAATALVGLLAGGLSSAAKPAADIRYWDTLPDAVDVGTGRIDTATFSATAMLRSESDEPVGSKVTLITASPGKCAVAWGREVPAPNTAPAPNAAYEKKLPRAVLEKDAVFRNRLLAEGPPSYEAAAAEQK